MNCDEANGTWTAIKGMIKSRWGKLTHNEILIISGNLEKLVGILQAVYGYSKEKAEDEYSKLKNAVEIVEQEARKSKIFASIMILGMASFTFNAGMLTTLYLTRKFKLKQ